eukprot:TRINITY_DN9462_c0_g1_i1.p1 TRINITY_DN9462_c0_g1~~TRINITY_DN9462_c0_g1_i1.p1  ORF type:complete len:419 (-),score=71.20 TRINITY_DN9462_c0_g1_i1:47-1303(-)
MSAMWNQSQRMSGVSSSESDSSDDETFSDDGDESMDEREPLEPGDVYSFGYGYFGQLGVDSMTSYVPVQIPSLKKITKVAAGEAHSMAISESGQVFSWGCNRYGQLGHGDLIHRKEPTLIEKLQNIEVLDISCGTQHSVVLTVDTKEGSIFTFGCGSLGRLGHGDNSHLTLPKPVSLMRGKRIIQVVAGNWFTLALSDNGSVFSWGSNRSSQIGHGKASTQLFPRHIPALYNIFITKITAGKNHTLFHTENGDILSLGSGACGQLGNKNRKIQISPSNVDKFTYKPVIAIASGYNHNIALDQGKTVYAWGYFSKDHLGIPESGEEYFASPFAVSLKALSRDELPTHVFAGGWHSALLTDQHNLYTWGCGYRGRLGIGAVNDEDYPQEPTLVEAFKGKKVLNVSCGGSHTLVIVKSKDE